MLRHLMNAFYELKQRFFLKTEYRMLGIREMQFSGTECLIRGLCLYGSNRSVAQFG